MRWRKPVWIAAAGLLAAAVAAPFLVSVEGYIPRIESAATARLGEPVTVGSLRLAFLPSPHVTIDGITVGTTGDIRLGAVRVTPDLFSLLGSSTVIRSIEIDALVLTRKAIDRIPVLAAAPQPPSQVRIDSIRLNGATAVFGKASFGPFDARVELDGQGKPGNASVSTQDGKFKALMQPEESHYRIDATAKAWTLPVDPALVFDELTAQGVATFDGADLSDVSARLYGGTAKGKLSLGWRKGLHLDGSLDIRELELQQIAFLLSPGARVSGKLDAKPVFSSTAASADQLMAGLRLESPFRIQNGVLHGVDIQKAATSLVKGGSASGETRFDHLSGHLAMSHGSYRFTKLGIASGVLAAEGNVTVSPAQNLSGRIHASVNVAGVSSSVPLNVGGTVGAPSLSPTGGTIAGAAVGTVILGPGFGTSVGAKIGGWAEDLFGPKGGK